MNEPELDRFIRDLMVPGNCQTFRELPAVFLSGYSIAEGIARMIIDQDWEGLRKIGLSVSALKIIGEAFGKNVVEIAASMSKIDREMSNWILGEMRASNPLLTMLP